MISYTIVGTSKLTESAAFFDQVLKPFDVSRVMENERMVFWMAAKGGPGLMIATPFDKQAATVGNGSMVALAAADREQVDAIYNKAIELGASCEGKPGQRDVAYAAYFRDLDGNKFNVICYG